MKKLVMIALDPPPIANILGLLALLCYISSLLPTILIKVFPKSRRTGIPQYLLKNRRAIGVMAFVLACGHGFILFQKRDIDIYDWETSWIYLQGITTLTIFTLLTITSNDWSVKKLKKNWKRLHKLTYLAMLLLIWHVWAKMSGHWTYVTPIAIVLIIGVTALFLIRLWKEYQKNKEKQRRKEQRVLDK